MILSLCTQSNTIYFNKYHFNLQNIFNPLKWSISHEQSNNNQIIYCNIEMPLLCVDSEPDKHILILMYDKLSFDIMNDANWTKIKVVGTESLSIKSSPNIKHRRLGSTGRARRAARELGDQVLNDFRRTFSARNPTRGRRRRKKRRRKRRRRRRRRRRGPRFRGIIRSIRRGLCGSSRCMDLGPKCGGMGMMGFSIFHYP